MSMKIYSMQEKIANFLLKNLLILFFSIDFFVKLLIHIPNYTIAYKYVIVPKLLILLFVSFFFYDKNRKLNTNFYITIALSIAYLISQVSLFNYLTIKNILFNGHYFLNSIVPILFISLVQQHKEHLTYYVKTYLYFIAINSFFIIVGYIFDINLFKTYYWAGNRFGFQGLLLYHSEVGYLYFMALFLGYYFYKINKSVLSTLILLLTLSGVFLIGTKKAFFLALIFVLYFFIDNFKLLKQKKIYYIIAPIFLSIFVIRRALIDVFSKQFELFAKIYKEDGFWSSFMSYRNVLLQKNFLPCIQEKWNLTNFVFGGPIFSNYRVELELFDLFLFFGLIGFISYIVFFKNILKQSNFHEYFITIGLFLASFFSGNLLSSLNVMILWILIIIFFKNETSKTLK